MNALDSGGEDYRFRNSETYLRHPNTYLPKYNIQSENERNDDSDDEYVGYGFPKHERSALLGSHGNLSTNVCDIDECELEAPELKKLNPKEWKSGSVTHTAVWQKPGADSGHTGGNRVELNDLSTRDIGPRQKYAKKKQKRIPLATFVDEHGEANLRF